jgi:ABC-type branched-subunit amino acid transport system ATPase component/branched-subunit amino acid ABC-type transport system permease component
MSEALQFAIIGLGAGALYSLASVGLVLVYRGSKVVNFAQSATGMIGAFVFYECHQNWHISTILAIPAAVLSSAAVSVIFYLLVIRRLRASSDLIKVVATLALFVVIEEVLNIRFGAASRIVTSSLPTGSVSIFGAHVGEDRLWIFGLVMVLTLVLWAIYRFTPFGLATSAVAENPTAAAALTISPNLIAAINWAVGAALGGLAAILLVPITGLSITTLSLIIIPVLAAAVIGRFSSFPITTLAALAIGVTQSEVTRYVSSPGWDTAVPFLFVTVILYFRGSRVARRNDSYGRHPSVGSGQVSPLLVGGGVVAALLCIWVIFPFDWVVALQYQMTFALILTSFVVVTGYTGQMSLAQMGMAGLGALMAAWLYSSYHVPFVLALVVGVLAVVPVGAVIALAGVRTRGVDLAIVTLGLAFSLEAIIFTNPGFTGGTNGFDTDNLSLFGLKIGGLEYPDRFATLTLLFLVLTALAVANLRRGRAGRRLIAVRTNERAAAAMGISVPGAKLYAFVLGGMIAALGGIMLAFYQPTPDFTMFAGIDSVTAAESAVLGGAGHLSGPLAASSFQPSTLTTQIFSFVGNNVAEYLVLLSGLLLLVLISFRPDGLAAKGLPDSVKARLPLSRRFAARPLDLTVPNSDGDGTAVKVKPVVLRLDKVSVTFGGSHALDKLTLEVQPGEIVGLIGPNGAGKTTAIDAITGFVRPSGGQITLGDEDLNRWGPDRRSRAGLARSFQSLELFGDLTVLENVQAASDPRDLRAYATDLIRPHRGELAESARVAIRDFGLEPHLMTQARHLSYAQQRLLAVARAVAGGGSILLLDEPASGLSDTDATALSNTIQGLARRNGMGVLLIEHNVDMVLRTCDRIVALNFGVTIGEGTPAEIRVNPDVISAYLGTAKHRKEQIDEAVLQ